MNNYLTEVATAIVDDLLDNDPPKEMRDAAIARTRSKLLTFGLDSMHSTTIQSELMNTVETE